jgi:RNA polymerase sigma factor (sigma-70 family)
MDAPDDLVLLREFAEHGSDAAFAELVSRHIGMVYAAALRQVRDPAAAEDVAQAVFIVLSRRAASFRPPRVLAGWLLATTRYAASNANRIARRRKRHERSAAQENTRRMSAERTKPDVGPEAGPERLAERLNDELDAAMATLTRRSRDALVLRFFADKSFQDVGRELGISEEAAKQRVFRGLEVLRGALASRGLAVPAAALGTLLASAATRAAPAGLASAAKLAATAAAPAPAAVAIAKGAMLTMAWSTAKTAVTAAALGILVGGASVAIVYHVVADRDEVSASAAAMVHRLAPQPNEPPIDARPVGPAYSRATTQGRAVIQVDYVPRAQAARAPFTAVPPPSADDAGTKAEFSIVSGALPDFGPNPVHCLNDGKMPHDEDEPNENFRFAIDSGEGRVKADLKRSIPIAQINTYSWHTDTRAPQYYRVYGSNGNAAGFDAGRDPASCGWELIASVDTRPPANPQPGGRYAVSISGATGPIGPFRYLLFVMLPTETADGFGHTFYSEIDIVEKK